MRDNRPQERLGVLTVEHYVTTRWKCGWQPLSASNDDGIDGIVWFRKHGQPTGRLAFLQIKCGESYRSETAVRPDHLDILLGEAKLNKHRPRWAAYSDPVVLIYVENPPHRSGNSFPRAWWCDLNSQSTYTAANKGIALIPKTQRFGDHSKGDIQGLAHWRRVPEAPPTVEVAPSEFDAFHSRRSLKQAAREWFCAAQSREIVSPGLGTVHFTRTGWRHLTRTSRRRLHMLQSLSVLPCVPAVLNVESDWRRIGRARTSVEQGCTAIYDHLCKDATVVFPHRGRADIRVVVRRRLAVDDDGRRTTHNWFLSAYEVSRGL